MNLFFEAGFHFAAPTGLELSVDQVRLKLMELCLFLSASDSPGLD